MPTFTWQEAGKGTAILLNFNLGSALNTQAHAGDFDRLLLDLLALANVRPGVAVTGVNHENLLLRLREQDGCLTIGMVTDKQSVGQEVEVILPERLHVYEADGSYLGHHQQLKMTLESPFNVLCAFAQRVEPPTLNLSRDQLMPGETATLSVDALARNGVYRLETWAPSGEIMRRRTALVLPTESNDPPQIRFAFNDAPGRYEMVLVDVRTGLRSRATITLSNPESK